MRLLSRADFPLAKCRAVVFVTPCRSRMLSPRSHAHSVLEIVPKLSALWPRSRTLSMLEIACHRLSQEFLHRGIDFRTATLSSVWRPPPGFFGWCSHAICLGFLNTRTAGCMCLCFFGRGRARQCDDEDKRGPVTRVSLGFMLFSLGIFSFEGLGGVPAALPKPVRPLLRGAGCQSRILQFTSPAAVLLQMPNKGAIWTGSRKKSFIRSLLVGMSCFFGRRTLSESRPALWGHNLPRPRILR